MSRELDVRIAREIFGAVWVPVPTEMAFREVGWLQIPKPTAPNKVTITPILARKYADGSIAPLEDCRHYSSSVEEAWKLFDVLGGIFSIKSTMHDGVREWTVRIGDAPACWANNAPEAICLAALESVRAGGEK